MREPRRHEGGLEGMRGAWLRLHGGPIMYMPHMLWTLGRGLADGYLERLEDVEGSLHEDAPARGAQGGEGWYIMRIAMIRR